MPPTPSGADRATSYRPAITERGPAPPASATASWAVSRSATTKSGIDGSVDGRRLGVPPCTVPNAAPVGRVSEFAGFGVAEQASWGRADDDARTDVDRGAGRRRDDADLEPA